MGIVIDGLPGSTDPGSPGRGDRAGAGSGEKRPRWELRFENFSRSFRLLQEIDERFRAGAANEIERAGMARRFDVCLGLAVNVLRDFLKFSYVRLPDGTPRTVVREAVAANLIRDGQDWMDALETRAVMSRALEEDDGPALMDALRNITTRFIPCFGRLRDALAGRRSPGPTGSARQTRAARTYSASASVGAPTKPDHGLSERQLGMIATVLFEHCPGIERVGPSWLPGAGRS